MPRRNVPRRAICGIPSACGNKPKDKAETGKLSGQGGNNTPSPYAAQKQTPLQKEQPACCQAPVSPSFACGMAKRFSISFIPMVSRLTAKIRPAVPILAQKALPTGRQGPRFLHNTGPRAPAQIHPALRCMVEDGQISAFPLPARRDRASAQSILQKQA